MGVGFGKIGLRSLLAPVGGLSILCFSVAIVAGFVAGLAWLAHWGVRVSAYAIHGTGSVIRGWIHQKFGNVLKVIFGKANWIDRIIIRGNAYSKLGWRAKNQLMREFSMDGKRILSAVKNSWSGIIDVVKHPVATKMPLVPRELKVLLRQIGNKAANLAGFGRFKIPQPQISAEGKLSFSSQKPG